MLTIHKILPKGFASNSYLLTVDGKSAVAIDPSQERVIEEAKKLNLTIEAVLLTHGHFDHVGACNKLYEEGVPIYCAKAEDELAHGTNSMYLEFGGVAPSFKANATLADGDVISLCGIDFKVIETPGHTAGSVTYQTENHLFVGDTLFRLCIGRCDLPTGDVDTIIVSIKKLYALSGDFEVHTGHEEDTTLAFERAHNYCVKG